MFLRARNVFYGPVSWSSVRLQLEVVARTAVLLLEPTVYLAIICTEIIRRWRLRCAFIHSKVYQPHTAAKIVKSPEVEQAMRNVDRGDFASENEWAEGLWR